MVSNIVQMNLSPTMAKKRIAIAMQDSSNLVIVSHSKARMKQRGITRRQIINCLVHGIFTEEPCYDVMHGGYHFTMRTVDAGDIVNVAGALHKRGSNDYVVVITVY